MLQLIRRNLLLYFRNWTNVILSLLGAIISFGLYLIFLRNNLEQSFSELPNARMLLNFWIIGGTLTITAMTTTLSNLSQMSKDHEQGVRNDLLIAPLGYWKLQASYLFSAILIGVIMQIAIVLIMVVYFGAVDKLQFNLQLLPELGLIIVLNAVLSSLINMIIVSFIKNVKTLGNVETIIGTASGFLIGVYMPIGIMPSATQLIMKGTPQLYIASLYRQLLMKNELEKVFPLLRSQMIELMGVQIKHDQLLTQSETYFIVMMITVIVALVLGVVLFFQNKKK